MTILCKNLFNIQVYLVFLHQDPCKNRFLLHYLYSQLSLNGHFYKTDTSVRRTPTVGPVPAVFQSFYCNYKLSIRQTPL